jgi:hypothetical protein
MRHGAASTAFIEVDQKLVCPVQNFLSPASPARYDG